MGNQFVDPDGRFVVTGTLLAVYLGKVLIESAIETGLEAGISKMMGNMGSFNALSTFGKNFAVNALVGWIPGAVEAKMAAKGAKYGAKAIMAAKIASSTLADAALSTYGPLGLSNGSSFASNALFSGLGNAGGELFEHVLKRRRALSAATGKMCFIADTQVLTDKGYKAIQDIKEKDIVKSKDPKTGEIAYKKVLNTFITHPQKLVHLTYRHKESKSQSDDDEDAAKGTQSTSLASTRVASNTSPSEASPSCSSVSVSESPCSSSKPLLTDHCSPLTDNCASAATLVGTAEHPFWLINKEAWVEMGSLQKGDQILLDNGQTAIVQGIQIQEHSSLNKTASAATSTLADHSSLITVNGKAVSRIPNPVTESEASQSFVTYNFEVEDFHTYFVAPAPSTSEASNTSNLFTDHSSLFNEKAPKNSPPSTDFAWVHNRGKLCSNAKKRIRRYRRQGMTARQAITLVRDPRLAGILSPRNIPTNKKGFDLWFDNLKPSELALLYTNKKNRNPTSGEWWYA